MTAVDNPIRRGLYVVTDPGTEAATLAVPFTEPRPATEPEPATATPEPTAAADVLTALAAMEARLDLKLTALIDVVQCTLLDLDALRTRLDRAPPAPFPGHP